MCMGGSHVLQPPRSLQGQSLEDIGPALRTRIYTPCVADDEYELLA
jgi:hypothetical protein